MTKRTSVRQRRVSAELRALRIKANLTCRQVSEGLGFSESKISRMETGDRGLYVDDVSAILGFLHAPSDKRQELLTLLREGEQRNWHETNGPLPPNWKDLIRFEETASVISNFETMVVPGLAQIPEYSRALIHGVNSQLSEHEVERLLAARASRQVIVSRRNAPAVHLLVEEMVLRRSVGGPEIMAAQLEHLLRLSRRSNVTIQVVPFAATPHPGLTGPFVVLEFVDEPALAYVESRGTSSFLEEPDLVGSVRLAWRELRAIAMSPEDSSRLIADTIGVPTPEEQSP
ncbi:helix-turn-helix transcriptional regulator [Amycolatopsis rhabdoformis]|uniref:Helix-turn-helix transcriptional regulator n=1 Tax=Amycolatopsis rhabdoformis TaxID=1448059 RepID=A0ABZ1I5R5_9PSEU|nr:helix-turn-helix transcriptional regulator [Amycolatopsis rhabdoformis]WSE28838.1 helix-turn-helix transcriptional regulator [Amycolatopsis rhabdoformis]